MVTSETMKFVMWNGKQKPEQFEGQPSDVLEMTFFGVDGPFEQAGLAVSAVRTNKEGLEINSVV